MAQRHSCRRPCLGEITIVKLLLDKGADVNLKDTHGLTAVQFAADADHPDIVKALLARGGKITLAAAACIGDLEQVQHLIQEGADPNAKGLPITRHWGPRG